MKLGVKLCWLAGITMFAASIMTTANAATLSFSAYNASVPGLDLSVDINVGGGLASFEFSNNSTGAAAGSSVARIYFESGLAVLGLSNGSVDSETGVEFSSSFGGPESPPGGNQVSWNDTFASFGAAPPPSDNGLGVGDSLVIVFDYAGSLADLINAITDPSGNARIAAHTLDCDGGESCASLAVVPVPAALPLLLTALAGLGFVRRRKVV